MTDTREGGCRCGQVRFRVEGRPMVTMACHCRGCQRMTASAFSLSALYSATAFMLTQGETVIGGMKAEPRHRFCPDCMSWVFTEVTADLVNIRAPLLDEPDPEPPFLDCYVSEKLPWASTGAPHAFDAFPDPADYPALMAEYAARTR